MQTPFLGCAYYPEDWPEEQIPEDIAKMKEAGITCARIAEFSWRKMEPVRGQKDFAWLHRVVDALREAGIAVVMGTPTATPPVWLLREYPDAAKMNPDGTRVSHGGRRHCCSVNPHYLEACDSIVEALGREFGDDPAIIGWQIDNEIYSWATECVCPECVQYFRRYLKRTYGTVEELNRRWDLNLFSQAYDRFDDVSVPIHGWHNPHLCFEWERAHFESDTAFIHRQADILRKYTQAPIGTDMMPFAGLDQERMLEKLDVAQFNHYHTQATEDTAIFWFDHERTLKDRPFWNTETCPTWNGSTSAGMPIQPEGFCRTNSWLPVALGGEANMYWLWREHWAGHELMHGSVLSPEGRPTHTFGEVQQTAAEFVKASDFLTGTKVKTDTAIVFTARSYTLNTYQTVVPDPKPEPDARSVYEPRVRHFHRALTAAGVRPDVIAAGHDLSPYKVILTPFLMTLEDSELNKRLPNWVRDGGTWIAGPLCDIRDDIGAHYTKTAYGVLEDLLGVRLDYTIPFNGSELTVQDTEGNTLSCSTIAECLSDVEEVLATVTEGHSALVGKTVIGSVRYGKGRVILCGTLPSDEDLARLLKGWVKDADALNYDVTGKVQVIPRQGEAGEGLILSETGGAEATVELPFDARDVLTGEAVPAGTVTLAPWDLRVLEKAE